MDLNLTPEELRLIQHETSYFSVPEADLDPKLFVNKTLKPWVRNGLLQILFDFLKQRYIHPDLWNRVWLAGSGVSYQWSAARQPGDLDVLIGVDYIEFRRAHPEYSGMSNTEISRMLNEDFNTGLTPFTSNWEGYEVTFYVNPNATDIRVIKPYAAYDLTNNEWTVEPDPGARAPQSPEWEHIANLDAQNADKIAKRYSKSLTDLQAAPNDAARRNAEFALQATLEQASALYDEIHGGRRQAFSHLGGGYSDFHNYRWQAGKRSGAIQMLQGLRNYHVQTKESRAIETYGIELPDTQTLIRRAAAYRAGR